MRSTPIPSQIPVKRLNARNCEDIQRILKTVEGTVIFGVSLRLNKKGRIDAVALTTPATAFHVVLSQDAALDPPNARAMSLGRVLQHPCVLLAGVHMPRLALILAHQLGTHVRGVDMSTLYTNSTFLQHTPAELVGQVFTKLQWDRIHRLWDCEANPDMWLRAWLCAR